MLRFILAAVAVWGVIALGMNAPAHAVDTGSSVLPHFALPPEKLSLLIKYADKILTKPLLKRSYTYEELVPYMASRSFPIDGRALQQQWVSEANRQTFALSISDDNLAGAAADELPTLAIAYTETHDPKYLNRLVLQLNEIKTWVPFQRRGWTLNNASSPVSDSWRDGIWLGTGWVIRGVAYAVWALPQGTLPAPLVAELKQRVLEEVQQIQSDWKNKVPWFAASHTAQSNQWIIPSAGLTIGALFVEKPDALADGIKNLEETANRIGLKGEHSEGISYALLSMREFYFALYALKHFGVSGALDNADQLRLHATWLVHHVMPGVGGLWNGINDFDSSYFSYMTINDVNMRKTLSLVYAIYDDKTAGWALAHFFSPLAYDFGPEEALASTQPPFNETLGAPPLVENYTVASHFNWRSSWADNATGFWLRGQHPYDNHTHNDCGHVSYYLNGLAILRSSGSVTGYGDADLTKYTQSGAASNVLQIGDTQQPALRALATVKNLPGEEPSHWSTTEGHVTLDASPCYGGGNRWIRGITWNPGLFMVADKVALPKPDVITFRWHLGDINPPVLVSAAPDKMSYQYSSNGALINLRADHPIEIQSQLAEAQYTPPGGKNTPTQLPVLVVKTLAPVTELQLTTVVTGGR